MSTGSAADGEASARGRAARPARRVVVVMVVAAGAITASGSASRYGRSKASSETRPAMLTATSVERLAIADTMMGSSASVRSGARKVDDARMNMARRALKELRPGDVVNLAASVPHAVAATEPCHFLLTMVKSA